VQIIVTFVLFTADNMRCERVTKKTKKKGENDAAVSSLSSLARTACYVQLKKTEIASYRK